MKNGFVFVAASVALVASIVACEREEPAAKSAPAQSNAVVDEAARQAVDAINTPMDKARGVEEVLKDAAERTAEQTKEAAP